MTSDSTQKESKKKASSKYYKKAAEKCTKQLEALSENRSTLTGEPLKNKPSPKSPTEDSDRSPTPDHLRFPMPEYLRDYVWETQMEQLKIDNEKLRIRQEEIEVEAMLLVLSDDNDDNDPSDELEYVPDSKGYLLLVPDSDGA